MTKAQAELLPPVDHLPVPATPPNILQQAVERGADIAVIEKLMALNERWEAAQAKKAFDEAIALAKAELPVISKNREVDFTGKTGIRTNYRHEDMAGIARQIDPILSKYGLSYRYRATSNTNEPVTVTCILSHKQGHSEETTLTAGRDESGNKNTIQAVGSTVTYLQRYTLKVALGLSAAVDDDGAATNAAKTLAAEAIETLRSKIQGAGADEAKFCAVFGVASLDQFPASKLDDADAKLLKFASQKKAEPKS